MNDPAARDILIALSLFPFLTPNRTRLLLDVFEPIDSVRQASSSTIEGLLSVTPAQAEDVRNPLTPKTRPLVDALRERVVTLVDDAYPPLLREIADPPLVLHVRGDVSLLAKPAVAVVGSRRASPYAINAAQHLTRALASAGLTIVSGLALGIDAAAHHAALAANGKTIAVLGTGIDVVYPRSNARLFRSIEREGLIVSEFPPGAPPKREHFPIRNRVISGLALGTVIVEATRHSGSLVTARMAAEQGREVFAVPGSIFSAGSEGTHRLIQYGAKLVHDANDIVEELPGDFQLASAPPPEPPPPALADVLAALTHDEGAHIDTLTQKLGGKPSASLANDLLQLELGGWIRALPGARYVRVK
ncbi:MAG: DNA-protecting protein DprA [Acidobacteria bacterium]|nr:DNA-protecting protein DprA [Acidobacteriota bacterium]MBV9478312.1 DNA-protecting protein DprA [Acidobacteriota bacterium]